LGGARLAELAWRWFCRAVLSTHFRRHEVDGLGRLPRRGPVLLCANHPSALADAAIIQAVCRRPVHPLARSGLFRNPLARPILAIIQAVPIYRRQDEGGDTSRNVDSFEACYRKFAAGGVLLIFPEGESHSHPGLRQVKTGAARLALGALQRNGEAPLVLPIGLNFSAVGRFRSSLLVVIGEPVPVERPAGESEEESVLRITGKLNAALRDVTLKQRFRALQKLSAAQHRLHAMAPHRVTEIADLLREFEQLCERFGVYDYHLTVEYTPALVARFLLRVVLVLLVAVPLGAWGLLNSIVPYSLTGYLAVRTASDRYQYDTAKILFGMLFFGLCWGGQTAFVYFTWGLPAAGAYALALLPTAAAALYLRRERERILDNIRVFFLFLRKKELRELLEAKREELERALARLAKMAAGRRIAG
jgi:1-acyl-sn-glycerol-3-phosphate acyltransferase